MGGWTQRAGSELPCCSARPLVCSAQCCGSATVSATVIESRQLLRGHTAPSVRSVNAACFAAANREFDAHTDTCVTTALHAHGVRAAQTPAAAWPSGAGAAGRGGGRETFSFGPSSVAQRLGAPSPHGGAAKLTGAVRCVSAWREADGEVRECRQAVHGSGRVAAAYPAGHRRITWPAGRTGVVCAGMCACRGMVLRSRTGRTGVVGAAGR